MTTARFHQTQGLRLLLVEDDPDDAELFSETLRGGDWPRFDIHHVGTLAAALGVLATQEFDVVILDMGLPDSQGLGTLGHVRAACSCAVIVHSGVGYEEMALAALSRGAEDYLAKGAFKRPALVRAVRYAMERRRALDELDDARRRKQRSHATRRIRTLGTRLASLRAPVGPDTGAGWTEGEAFAVATRRQAQLIEWTAGAEAGDAGLAERVQAGLCELAETLLELGAGPGDLVELHGRATRIAMQGKSSILAQAHLAESRVMLMALMSEFAELRRIRARVPVRSP